MKLQNYWPLFLLICIPIIVILWLLKQKATDYHFSSLFLWKEDVQNTKAAAPWAKLKKKLLMILQILTVIFLITAMTSPYIPGNSAGDLPVIIAVDISGSMNIRMDTSDKTRFEAAVSDAVSYVDQLPDKVKISVISLGAEAAIAQPFSEDKEAVKESLQQLSVKDAAGDIKQWQNFLNTLAQSYEKTTVAVFSDREFSLAHDDAHLFSYTSEGMNVSVDSLSYASDPQQGMIALAIVSNRGNQPFDGEIDLYVDNILTDIMPVTLDIGEQASVYFNFSGDETVNHVLEARLNTTDFLDKDNRAFCLTQKYSDKRALLVGDVNVFTKKALETMGDLTIYTASELPENADYDLYVFEDVHPAEVLAADSAIYINPPGATETIQNQWVRATDCGLMQYVYPCEFAAAEVQILTKPDWAVSFLETDAGCAGYYGINQGRFEVVFGFDFHATDFVLDTKFPIMIHNLINMAGEQNLLAQNTCVAGESIVINAALNDTPVSMTTPGGQKIMLDQGETTPILYEAGLYRFEMTKDAEVKKDWLCVAFPTDSESGMLNTANMDGQTNPQTADSILDSEPVTEQSSAADEITDSGVNLKNICIAGALLMLMIEWIVWLKQR